MTGTWKTLCPSAAATWSWLRPRPWAVRGPISRDARLRAIPKIACPSPPHLVAGLFHGCASWKSLRWDSTDSPLLIRLRKVARCGPGTPAGTPLATGPGDQNAPQKNCTGSVSGGPTFRVNRPPFVINPDDNFPDQWDTGCEPRRRDRVWGIAIRSPGRPGAAQPLGNKAR